MQTQRTTGWLLLAGAAGVLIPYTLLTIQFQYPDILRKDAGTILTTFHAGGPSLILTWFAFGILGLPLVFAYQQWGRLLRRKSPWMQSITTIGVAGLLVQMIGLLRWTFVIPALSASYVETTDAATKAAILVNFRMIHQFAGVLLGEHLGQLFTITWTLLLSVVLYRSRALPRWLSISGIMISLLYLLAQAELLATVIPGFPVWCAAGPVGSTLWLVWLVAAGVLLVRGKLKSNGDQHL